MFYSYKARKVGYKGMILINDRIIRVIQKMIADFEMPHFSW